MITVITLARNEQYLAPFFLWHYAFADWIVVFDNQSTDRTREILGTDKRVRIVSYDTGGLLDDVEHLRIKNEAYKNMAGDWFIIVDFDEFVWHPNLPKYLDQCSYEGITLPRVEGWSMIGTAVPENDGRRLTALLNTGVPDPYYCKSAIVHRDVDVRYTIGAHGCLPLGKIKQSPTAEVKLLHYNWISREYGLEKRRKTSTALSASNLVHGYGLQCFNLESEGLWYDDALARVKTLRLDQPQQA